MVSCDHVAGRRRILLFYPKLVDPSDAEPGKPDVPISVMTLADHLEKHGFLVDLFDNRLPGDIEKTLNTLQDQLLCVGVSIMAGYQVVDGYEFSKFLKARYPWMPVVWGGWTPTAVPDQCLRTPFVDIVVKGQGERLFPELVMKLRAGVPIDELTGISYKDEGRIVHNPLRPLMDINEFLPVDHSRIDPSNYSLGDGMLHFGSSFGCPYVCTFCGMALHFRGRWIGLRPERVIAEIKTLSRDYRIKMVDFWDSTLFVDLERIKTILRGFKREGLRFGWKARSQVKQIIRFDDELIDLMKETGCQRVVIGIESGSQRIRTLFNKDIDYERLMERLAKLSQAGIPIRTNFLLGPPTEKREDFLETLRSMTRVQKLHPENSVVMYTYLPVPGTELGKLNAKKIEQIPKTIDAWDTYYKKTMTRIAKPWLQKRDDMKRQPAIFYFHLAMRMNPMVRSPLFVMMFRTLKKLAVLRLSHEVFSFPVEWYLYKFFKRLLR